MSDADDYTDNEKKYNLKKCKTGKQSLLQILYDKA